MTNTSLPSGSINWLPKGPSLAALVLLLLGLMALYGDSYVTLANTVWKSDEQGHGPIIFAVSLWLIYQQRFAFAQLPEGQSKVSGYAILLFGCLLYVVGHSQDIWIFTIGSQIVVLGGLMLIYKGWPGLRVMWFPLFFMLFMIPLPEALVAAVTAPLKSAVSAIAAQLLYWFGYPVGRSGVLLTVGQYQLLVADACAGLNSMFTLEALGMLYMNLMRYTSVPRNVILAVMLVPTAFLANVCRVMILVLVTYYFGDEAGQGFVHGFAGMVLFMVALMLMIAIDRVLGLFFDKKPHPAKKELT